MIKKYLSRIVSMVLVLCVVFSMAITVSADEELSVPLMVYASRDGNTIHVTVEMCTPSTAMRGVQYRIAFDTSKLAYNDDASGNIFDWSFTEASTVNNKGYIICAGDSEADITKGGVLATMSFTMSDSASGSASIGLGDGKVALPTGVTFAAIEHKWNNVEYTFSEDGSSCVAKRVCAHDATHVQTATAKITSEVKTSATCVEMGTTTYTATFTETWAGTQVKDVQNIPATGIHNYIDGVCENCGEEELKWQLGDLDHDGDIDNNDVEYLLWYTLFPEDYPIEDFADFDHSGEVDNKDVEYLLWYTLFPEDYPLTVEEAN